MARGDAAPQGPRGWQLPPARLAKPGRPVWCRAGHPAAGLWVTVRRVFSSPCPIPNVGINPSNRSIASPGANLSPSPPGDLLTSGVGAWGGCRPALGGISGDGDASPGTSWGAPGCRGKGLPGDLAEARRSLLLPVAAVGFIFVEVFRKTSEATCLLSLASEAATWPCAAGGV